MGPMIQQALMMGMTANQVLQFITSRVSSSSRGISNAQAQGFTATQILNFLSNKISPKDKRGAERHKDATDEYLAGAGIKNNREREDTRNKFISGAIGLGAAGLGAAQLYRSFPAMRAALGGQASVPSPVPEGDAPGGIEVGPGVQGVPAPGPAGPAPAPIVGGAVPGGQGAAVKQSATDLLTSINVVPKINNLLNAKNNPQQIAAVLQATLTPHQKKWLGSQTQATIEDLVTQYLTENPTPQADASQQNDQNAPQAGVMQTPEQLQKQVEAIEAPAVSPANLIKSAPEISKLSAPQEIGAPQGTETSKVIKPKAALLPNGEIGTIISQDGKATTVEYDGKEHKISTDKVSNTGISLDELADAYQRLHELTPESERSSAIHFAGYDPDAKEFVYIPHGGSAYVYENVDSEFAEAIKGMDFLAKTTGTSIERSWTAGLPSRGAGVYKLIQQLKGMIAEENKSRKENGLPPIKEYIRKYGTVFDAYGAGKSASDAKQKRLRNEEKNKIKAQKAKK